VEVEWWRWKEERDDERERRRRFDDSTTRRFLVPLFSSASACVFFGTRGKVTIVAISVSERESRKDELRARTAEERKGKAMRFAASKKKAKRSNRLRRCSLCSRRRCECQGSEAKDDRRKPWEQSEKKTTDL